jgi:hypothetical protein
MTEDYYGDALATQEPLDGAAVLDSLGYGDLPPEPVEGPESYASQVAREALRLQIREEARLIHEERKAGTVTLPDFQQLQALLDEPDEDVRWVVDGLLGYGSKFMLAAQNKAGKTTLTGNLVRALADGGLFLDSFGTTAVQRIVVIDDEMSKRDLRRWYRDLDIQTTTAVDLVPMRGYGSTFNILVPKVRTMWAERLRGADVVILDCLRPILDALGLDENHDAGRFLEAFDALMAEAGVETYGVVHHMGHSGERARGDSRILDWPDAVWSLRRDRPADPDAPEDDADVPRFFSAYGRDVGVSEGLLSYDKESRSLTYDATVKRGRNRADRKVQRIREEILKHCTQHHPEKFKTGELAGVLRAAGVPFSKGEESPVISQLVADGLLEMTPVGTAKLYAASSRAMSAESFRPNALALP